MNRSISSVSPASNVIESMESRRLYTAVNVVGTSGADTIYITTTPTVLTVTLNGTATNYTHVTSITVSGGTGNDDIEVAGNITLGAALSGNSGNDTILGGGGNDSITGNDGDDVLAGKAGADVIDGGLGTNSLYQNDGSNNFDGSADTIYSSTSATDSIFLRDAGDSVTFY